MTLPKPYYQNDLVTIYHGNCLDILPYLDPVDLVLTDPQYGIGEDGKTNSTRSCIAESKDYDIGSRWDNERFPDILKIVKMGTHAIVWGGNYYTDVLGASSCWIVWDKDNGKNDFADCELAWTNFETAVRKFKYKWHGMIQKDMKNKEIRCHPTQKPVELFKWVMLNYSKKGMSILDPFCGSGTTGIVSMLLKRKCVLIDKEEKYCEISAKRCNETKTGLTPGEQDAGQRLLFQDRDEKEL